MMTCPKCHGEMRQYERSGVTIDQCGECRGIFLDRGELEKLFDAEQNWNQQHTPAAAQRPPAQPGYAPPPAPGYAPPPPPPPAPSHGYPPPAPAYGGGHGSQYGYHGHYRHKRRKGFLGELFD
ncbi:zf-TFIIB domain-containing protein [Micromonospora sp. CPCC 205371]|nr:zf-TFIIB domain-containing protein [Micromonospora sp. CPCC 205371]